MEDTADDLTPRHLAKIVDSSDDAIVSKDLNGIVLSWNGAAERMFGYTAAEAVGQSIRIIIPEARQSEEDFVLSQFTDNEVLAEDVSIKTEENDLGYNFTFGYRFTRYVAAEIGVAQYGCWSGCASWNAALPSSSRSAGSTSENVPHSSPSA